MNISVVLGLGFGDEGKGAFTNYLCSQLEHPLVVRFNSGHQCGHTVVVGDNRHVFSNFGSGTLLGVPTYWSEYCTVDPVGVYKEAQALKAIGITPTLYYNSNAMVTTPFDKLANIQAEKINMHGSVGVGFGKTIQRNEDHYHLFVRDLQYPAVRDAKLRAMAYYYPMAYQYYNDADTTLNEVMKDFIDACDFLVENYEIIENISGAMTIGETDLVFEGGQGILLDMDYGFFPNVTRSNTTSKNAIAIIKSLGIEPSKKTVQTFYITRAYQTRHGQGYMSNLELDNSYIKINPNETNVDTGFQGTFRRSVLDLDLLDYALECDMYENPHSLRSLVVTCLDQVPACFPVTKKGKMTKFYFKKLGDYLDMSNVYGFATDKGYNKIPNR
jgi:adenylosuccinate synthase